MTVRIGGNDRRVVRGRYGDNELVVPDLGYDVDDFSDFDHVWPMQDSSLPVEDINGNLDLTADTGREPTLQGTGVDNDYAIWFGPNDHLENRDVNFGTDEAFTMGAWLNHGWSEEFMAGMTLQHTETTSEALGISANTGRHIEGFPEPEGLANPKILSVANTPGYSETTYPANSWHFFVLRYDPDEHLAELYFDGEFDYDVEPDDDPSWIALLDEVEFGYRLPAGSDYPYEGYISWAWLTSGLLPEPDIRRLYRYVRSD